MASSKSPDFQLEDYTKYERDVVPKLYPEVITLVQLPLEIISLIVCSIEDRRDVGNIFLANSIFRSSLSEKDLIELKRKTSRKFILEENDNLLIFWGWNIPRKGKRRSCIIKHGPYSMLDKHGKSSSVGNYYENKKHGVFSFFREQRNVNTSGCMIYNKGKMSYSFTSTISNNKPLKHRFTFFGVDDIESAKSLRPKIVGKMKYIRGKRMIEIKRIFRDTILIETFLDGKLLKVVEHKKREGVMHSFDKIVRFLEFFPNGNPKIIKNLTNVTTFFEDGEVHSIRNFISKDNKIYFDGCFLEKYPNGNFRTIGQYSMDIKVGKWIKYDVFGNIYEK